jgi:hypothetical protein
MSQRTTVPPTRNHSRSPASGRKGLIARTKTKKQSARRELPLTIAFIEHISRSAASGHREPSAERHGHCRRFSNNAICSGRDAAQVSLDQALQRRASERPLVRCYAELAAVIVVRGSRAPRMNERQQRLAPLNLASVSRRSR